MLPATDGRAGNFLVLRRWIVMKAFFGKLFRFLGLDTLLLQMLQRLLQGLVKKLENAAAKCSAALERITEKLVAV